MLTVGEWAGLSERSVPGPIHPSLCDYCPPTPLSTLLLSHEVVSGLSRGEVLIGPDLVPEQGDGLRSGDPRLGPSGHHTLR